MRRRRGMWLLFPAVLLLLAAGCQGRSAETGARPAQVVRLGYMANLTHAQAVLGVADGSFERTLGVPVTTKLFSSGPSAITALLAGELDLLYVGPSPAVTGYIRSEGEALRVIAGAASGGSVLVLRPGLSADRLDGLRLATPGVANTQDVALRHYLNQHGWKPRERGGRVTVTPLPNAEILGLFARGQLDGAWVPEPWGARLVQEAGAVLALDERDLWPDGRFPTTVVVAATPFLEQNPDLVRRFLAAHGELTRFLQERPTEAAAQLQTGLEALQGRPLPDSVLHEALGRIDFTADPMPEAVEEQAMRAYHAGYLGARRPDLTNLFVLTTSGEVAP